MTIESIGYGAGTRDLPGRANVLRIFVGTSIEPPMAAGSAETDRVYVLETNLDDVSAEIVGYTKQRLFDAGALDVFTTPIQMKKDRPGVILSLICSPADVDALESILFDETGTFGIRRHLVERSKRARQEHTVETVWGPVRGKLGYRTADGGRSGDRALFTPEFDDCAQLAAQHGVSLRDVYRAAEAGFAQNSTKTTPAARHHDDDQHHDHQHLHDHGHNHHH